MFHLEMGSDCRRSRQELFRQLPHAPHQEALIRAFLLAVCNFPVITRFLLIPQPFENLPPLTGISIHIELLDPFLLRIDESDLQLPLHFDGCRVAQIRKLQNGTSRSRNQFSRSKTPRFQSRTFTFFNLHSKARHGGRNREQAQLFLPLETFSQPQNGLKWITERHEDLCRQSLQDLQRLLDGSQFRFSLLQKRVNRWQRYNGPVQHRICPLLIRAHPNQILRR